MKVKRMEEYLERMEKNRKRDEHLNRTAYNQARELSAWMSILKHGRQDYADIARKVIES